MDEPCFSSTLSACHESIGIQNLKCIFETILTGSYIMSEKTFKIIKCNCRSSGSVSHLLEVLQAVVWMSVTSRLASSYKLNYSKSSWWYFSVSSPYTNNIDSIEPHLYKSITPLKIASIKYHNSISTFRSFKYSEKTSVYNYKFKKQPSIQKQNWGKKKELLELT